MICDPANPRASGPVSVWQETFPVRFGAIDRSDRMTLSEVFRFFQEAAISHAENLGVGREDMTRIGQIWILSRMSVQIERRPSYYETITVRSWPRGGEKLFALRDYDIRDKDDIPVVRARSGWIIIDLEKRRPLRPQSVMDRLPMNEGLDALTSGPIALSERNNLQKTGERRALYTDVDYNGHVNNVRYIQWIEDALDSEILEKANRMRLDINYISEILSNSLTEIFIAPIDNSGNNSPNNAFAFEGRNSNQASFRAELGLWE